MSRVCRYSLSNPPPSKGPLNGNETIEEADLLDVQALQAEKGGDDAQCIQIMERSVQIRARVISQMSELLQSSNADMSVCTAYNNALPGLSAAAERLAIKCNTFAIQKFKQRDFNTAESLLKYILDLTSEQGSFLCQSDERRCYLRSVTLNNLGCMERRRGHYPEALKYLQESMEVVGSESPIPYISISAILLQLRQCEDAANMAQRAIDLMPDAPKDPSLIAVAHHNLAMALETISKDASFEEYEVAYKMASATLGKESPTTQMILANWQRFERIHSPEMTLAGRSAVVQSSLSKSPMNVSQLNRPSSLRKRELILNSKQDPHQMSGSNHVADIFPHPFFRSQYEIPDTSSFSTNNKPQPYSDSSQHFAHKPLFPHVKGVTADSRSTERRPLPKYTSNLPKGKMETSANSHTAASDIVSAVDKLPHTFPGNTERFTQKSLAQPGRDRGWVETLPQIGKSAPFLPNIPKHNTPRKAKASSSKVLHVGKAVSPPYKALATKEFSRNKTVARKISSHKAEAAKEAPQSSSPQPLYNALSSAQDPTDPINSNRADTSAVRGHPAHTAFVKASTANTLIQSKNQGMVTSHSPKRAAPSSDCVVRRDAAEGIYTSDTLITSPSFSRPSKDLVESMIDRLDMLLHDEEEMERKYMKALIIQRNYRRHLSQRLVLAMRMNMEFENRLRRVRENFAARIIQMAYRRTLGNRSVARGCRRPPRRATRGMVNMAAVRIQSVARGWLARREYLRRKYYQRVCDSASTRIQNWFRCLRARQVLQGLKMQRRLEEEPIFRLQRQDYAANIIQKVWRTYRQIRLSREELQQRRVRRLEEEMHLLSKAATRIQSVWRGFVCRRQVSMCMVVAKQREAERREYQRLRKATIKIQSFCRGMLVRRQTSPFLDRARRRVAQAISHRSRAHAAAGVIQRAYRCHLGRRRLCLLKAEHNVVVRESRILALVSLVQRVGRGYLVRLNLSKEVSHFAHEAKRYHQRLSVLHQDDTHSESEFPMEQLHLLVEEEETQRSVIEIEERRAWRSIKQWGNTIPINLTVLQIVRSNSVDLAEATDAKREGPTEEVGGEVCVRESEELCDAKPNEESAAFTITRFMRRVRCKRALARRIKAIEHLREQEEGNITEEAVPGGEPTSEVTPSIAKKLAMELSPTSISNHEAVIHEQEELRKLMEMERILEEADIFQRLLEAETAMRTALPDKEECCVDNDEEGPQEPSEAGELYIKESSFEPNEGGTVSIVAEEAQLPELGDCEVQTVEPTTKTDLIETTSMNASIGMKKPFFLEDETLLKALEEERVKRSHQRDEEKRLRVEHQKLIDARQEYCMKKIYQAQTKADLIPYMRNRLRLTTQINFLRTRHRDAEKVNTTSSDSEAHFISKEVKIHQAATKIANIYRAHLFRQYLSILKNIYHEYINYRVEQERCDGPVLTYTQMNAYAKESQHQGVHESGSTLDAFCADASLLILPQRDDQPPPAENILHDLAEATDAKREGPTEEVGGEVCVRESEELCDAKPNEESAAFTITRFMRRVRCKRALARRIKAIEHLREQEEGNITEEAVPGGEPTSEVTPSIAKKLAMELSPTSISNHEAVIHEQEELRKLMEMERILEEADIFQRLLEAETAMRTALPDKEECCVDNDEEGPQEPSEAGELYIKESSFEPNEGGTVSIVAEEAQLPELGDCEVQTVEPTTKTDLNETIETIKLNEYDAVRMHTSAYDSHAEPMLNALLDTAARILQQFFRFVVARKKLLRLQQLNRERLSIELEAEAFLNNASTVIQSVFRGHLARRRVRELYANQKRYLRYLHDELTCVNSDENEVVLTDAKVSPKGKSFEGNVLFSDEVETQFNLPSCDHKKVFKEEAPAITAETLSVAISNECRSISRSTASIEEIESND